MLSRTASNIYWMTRYIERAENVARFIDVNLQLMLDLPQVSTQHWEALALTTGDRQLFKEHYGSVAQDSVMRFLTFDKNNPNSILSTIYATRENARSIREIISSEMWEQANTFYLMLREASNDRQIFRSPHTTNRRTNETTDIGLAIFHG